MLRLEIKLSLEGTETSVANDNGRMGQLRLWFPEHVSRQDPMYPIDVDELVSFNHNSEVLNVIVATSNRNAITTITASSVHGSTDDWVYLPH